MSKFLCIASLALSGLLLLVFLLDLSIGIPFNRVSFVMDIGFAVAAAIVATLSFLTLRELR